MYKHWSELHTYICNIYTFKLYKNVYPIYIYMCVILIDIIVSIQILNFTYCSSDDHRKNN